jgi:fatty acid kinase
LSDTNLLRFRSAVAGALAHLESRRQEVNDLNVFPVADGDTGDNMVLTLRAVLGELDRLEGAQDGRTIDEIGREEIVQSVARAALLGARGNSGVILSQLIRGAAEELASRPGQLVDATLIGAALVKAADRAYASVRQPAEGTILTVAREMAHRIVADVAHGQADLRLEQGTDPRDQDQAIAKTLEHAIEAGQQSVKRGPQLLSQLREAGVVDAGGHALTVIFAGVVAALRSEDPPELEHYAPARITHPEHTSGSYRYCTNFAVTGQGLSPARFTTALEELGDSVLVVGDSTTLKVHVHTDEPERAAAVFEGAGTVSRLDVADMRLQVAERDERLTTGAAGGEGAGPGHVRCGAVAVVNGGGLREMFEELGVHTIDGGPTLNPSTYELLAGIHEVPAEEVVVLPSSPNVVMAAERAAELSEKQVTVVPSRSQQASLAAAVALQADRGLRENASAMLQALDAVRTGSVAEAARADAGGRFEHGDAVGFVEEQLVAWGEPLPTLRTVLEKLSGEAELVSVLAGAQAPVALSDLEGIMDGHVELELRHGGQSAYWWLLAAE